LTTHLTLFPWITAYPHWFYYDHTTLCWYLHENTHYADTYAIYKDTPTHSLIGKISHICSMLCLTQTNYI